MTEHYTVTVPPIKCYACDGKLERDARAEIANLTIQDSKKTTHIHIRVPFCRACDEANKDNKDGMARFLTEGFHKRGETGLSVEELRSLYLHPKK